MMDVTLWVAFIVVFGAGFAIGAAAYSAFVDW